MSTLLVLNSGSKVAQSLVRALHGSQTFDKIICADLFPSYTAIQGFLEFKHTLPQNNTKIEEVKFVDRQDIQDLAVRANNLLYVTHDYYQVVPHKIDLLTNALGLAPFTNYKKLIYVAPVELDHQLEEDSTSKWRAAETAARVLHPKLTGLRVDVTFGPDSTLVHRLLTRMHNNLNIHFKPLGSSPAPISTQDLAQIVQKLFVGDHHNGKSFLAQGPKPLDWNMILQVLEKASKQKAILNQSSIENLITPTTNTLLSEFLYDSQYRNLTQLIKNFRNIPAMGFEDASTLLQGKKIDFEQYYSQNEQSRDHFPTAPSLIEKVLL